MSKQDDKRSEATQGGVYVLSFIASAIAFMFGAIANTIADRVFIALVVAALIYGIFRLGRFVREHGDEIGEARFDTRNNRD